MSLLIKSAFNTRAASSQSIPNMQLNAAERAHRRFITSLVLAPPLLLGLSFATAVALTQAIAPGMAGAEAFVIAAVLMGLAGGFVLAKLNPQYALQAPVYAASFSCLLYFSLRLFWLNAPLTLAAAGFALILPSALLGAVATSKLRKR